jgi:hypothetical protein
MNCPYCGKLCIYKPNIDTYNYTACSDDEHNFTMNTSMSIFFLYYKNFRIGKDFMGNYAITDMSVVKIKLPPFKMEDVYEILKRYINLLPFL